MSKRKNAPGQKVNEEKGRLFGVAAAMSNLYATEKELISKMNAKRFGNLVSLCLGVQKPERAAGAGETWPIAWNGSGISSDVTPVLRVLTTMQFISRLGLSEWS